MKNNPFRKQTGNIASHYTCHEKELNELEEAYYSTKNGIPNHLILYGPKGIGKTSLLLKFEEKIADFDDAYSLRIPLSKGSFKDIYTLIIEKCSDTLNINNIPDKITSLGINIPLKGEMTISDEIPKTSPAFAFEKMLNVIYDELDSKNPVLIILFDDLQNIMDNNEEMKILSILQIALVEANLKGKNIMFAATISQETYDKIEDKSDSAVRIFEPILIETLS